MKEDRRWTRVEENGEKGPRRLLEGEREEKAQ
jgi:hypothetical protein